MADKKLAGNPKQTLLKVVANNGLLDRRLLLKSGLTFAAASVTASMANASNANSKSAKKIDPIIKIK